MHLGFGGCLLFLCLLHCCVAATLYGNAFIWRKDVNQSVTFTTMQIDMNSGNFTYLVDEFYYFRTGYTYDGVSTFDQQRGIMYFATNGADTNVYGVDVNTGEKAVPIVTGAATTSTVLYDNTRDQLLLTLRYSADSSPFSVHGEIEDKPQKNINKYFTDSTYDDYEASDMNTTTNYNFLLSVDKGSGGMNLVANFTEMGVGQVIHSTITQSGIFYFTFVRSTSPHIIGIGSFNLSDPSQPNIGNFPCKGLLPLHVTYNEHQSAVIGLATDFAAVYNYYFVIINGQCKTTLLQYVGGLTAATYDPTTGTFYMNSGANLVTFVASKAPLVTLTALHDPLIDIEVWYQ